MLTINWFAWYGGIPVEPGKPTTLGKGYADHSDGK